jgi:hypothetical protein
VDTTATEVGRIGESHSTLEVVITADGRTMVTVMNNVKASAWDIYRISPDARSVVSADRPVCTLA